jgi:hypothetical protein
MAEVQKAVLGRFFHLFFHLMPDILHYFVQFIIFTHQGGWRRSRMDWNIINNRSCYSLDWIGWPGRRCWYCSCCRIHFLDFFFNSFSKIL